MAATKIKVIIHSVVALDDADLFGAGEWRFTTNVKHVATGEIIAFGDVKKEFEVDTGDTVNIGFSKELEVKGTDTKLEINLSGIDVDTIWDDNIGKIKITLNTPIVHAYDLNLTSDTGNYIARVKVDILSQTTGSTGSISTILQNSSSSTYNTVHDEMLSKMVHIHPVIPVPWTTGIPPIAKGVQTLTASPQVNLSINAGAAPNGLVNPAFIATINPTHSDFAKRVARVRITQYRPNNLDLSKIIWKAVSSNIKFWNGSKGVSEIKGGQEVKVYGTNTGADQQCKIEARWDSEGKPLLAVFRAWVGKPKYLFCRANIIKTTATVFSLPLPNPSVTVAEIKKHIAFSNAILWQAGIEIVMDKDATAYNGAVKKDVGIFEINSATNYTYNVTYDANMLAQLFNARKGIVNLAYIHSAAGKPTLLGAATDRRMSPAETNVTLSGVPSSSWLQPSGVFPDGDATTVSMKRMGPSNTRNSSLKSNCGDGKADTLNNLCACFMTQNVKAKIATGEVTLPHELGHVIGLHHRGNGGNQTKTSYDEVNHKSGARKGWGHPWIENLMTYGSDSVAQDIDMIQAQVIRNHPLMKDTKPSIPKPPFKPPPAKKPVPAEWLPSKADIELLQGYLGGTKPGLKNTGYFLGTSGPKGDGVDGDNGSKTKQAIKDFQRDHGGLKQDKIYGPNTRAAFDKELNST